MDDRFVPSSSGDQSHAADGFRLILSVQLAVRRLVNQRTLTTLDMPFPQVSALVELARGESVSCNELAERLAYDASHISRLTHDLESRRLIARHRNERDRRALDLLLTSTGLVTAAQASSLLMEAENTILSGFTAEERGGLKRLLQRILR
ncbi:MarR family winged helix-turn-helix transcriptional regulator [Paraburkholderia sp. EG287A]|uniref:MarR family winged helix-turn-helix transcriptional regulator n=1 Tax=unclassified Paraburkholderia TaxID=2615204 RepID=UPI0034D29F23